MFVMNVLKKNRNLNLRGSELAKSYYYKFMIKSYEKVSQSEINTIKREIIRVLIDIPMSNVHGGEANNNGYEKFKTEGNKVGNSA